MLDFLIRQGNYVIYIALMMVGLYAVLARGNLLKKIIGLNLLQTAVFLFYISIGEVRGSTVPVLIEGAPSGTVYANPIPHVLMLTAIVVGVSVTAVALALVVRIRAAYGSVEEDDLVAADQEAEREV